ncbi:MAG: extracellular solute-binding protein [Sulfolobaceae archaeon]|nr:extracellular solute-binding protein [Sulfolobaceae archaeon]
MSKGLSTIVIASIVIVIIVVAVIAGILLLTTHKTSVSVTTTTSPVSTTTTSSTSQGVTIYVAGAYLAIFNYLASQFYNETHIPVHVIPGGSFALAAEIAKETPVPANVFVPVAYIQAVELEGSRNPGWAIAFISDQMAIIYSNYTTQNPYWNELYSNYTMAMKTNESKYWFNFFYLLTSGHFSLGISNPSSDPEGLYAYLILQMAGYLYANHNISYFVDRAEPYIKSAPTTADYVPSLKAGTLDFTFSYVSYAVSQHLDYLQLPPWLSFGYYPNETHWYSMFSYTITVNGQNLTIRGNPVYLYITVPLNATNVNASYEFIKFLISHVNELSMFHVIPIYPALLFYNNESQVPQPILQLLNNGELKYAGNFSQV